MDLIIKNRFTPAGGSYVRNLAGEDVYKVKGRWLSFTRKKFVMTMDGKLLFMVRNKYWRIFRHSAMIYDPNGNLVAKAMRKISMADDYIVSGYQPELSVVGQVMNYNYQILCGGRLVAKIFRPITFVNDVYELTILDDSMASLLVALVIAVDNIADQMRHS